MAWEISDKNDLFEIIKFLRIQEWQHIQATSLYISNFKPVYPKPYKVITLLKKVNNEIHGLISITSLGLIYPVLSSGIAYSPDDRASLIKLLSKIFFRPHGVIGLKRDVDFLDSILLKPIRGVNDYKLLNRNSLDLFQTDEKYIIKKATLKDLSKLIPMEYEYQKEEVLLDPKDLNKKAIFENFKQKLKIDDIYYLLDRKFPISKAATNYKSMEYTLIGGVFTWKEKRNMGYSTALLKYLINDQSYQKLKTALFVKSSNQAAIHLYDKLGFKNSTEYKINYYKV